MLQFACRYGDTAALARLLARGCPVDAADYDGRSLLHVAVHNKQEVRSSIPACLIHDSTFSVRC